ncbi:MAG: ribbon-helix-helix protein, CopG family [Micromonosporaceae bacterium]
MTDRSAREKVNVRLDPDGLVEVDRLAEVEHRTRSDMIRVLLLEALTHRRKGCKP